MRMYLLTIQSVLVAILLVLPEVQSFRWLGINSSLVDESDTTDLRRYLCSSSSSSSKNRLLDKAQKRICRKDVSMMKYVVTAAELARTECLRLTKYNRWNCRGILQAPKFSRDLRVGTQQSAFVHALSSAALVFAVTQGCAADESCQCGKQPSRHLLKRNQRKYPRKTLRYSTENSCHDNIAYGIKFSKDFLDPREVKQTRVSRMLVNLHNNDLGRKLVQRSLNITCSCPPLRCQVQTCQYRLIIPFSKIAEQLFDTYNAAKLVSTARVKGRKKDVILVISNKVGKNKKSRMVQSEDMVYYQRSRDFCRADITRGRVCSVKLRLTNKVMKKNIPLYNPDIAVRFNVCPTLCCGRGYNTKTVIKSLFCKCRYSDSRMQIICKKCGVPTDISICR